MENRCGRRIPASEHAVSMSLPTMRDVIGYEEQECSVLQHVCSGYPRFVCHWMVERLQECLGGELGGRMAHYDLVRTAKGRSKLRRYGVETDLLRISVGTESIASLCASFDHALRSN